MSHWYPPEHWSDDEADMWDDLVTAEDALGSDDYAQILFHAAYFDLDLSSRDRDALHDALVQYLEDKYDLDFMDQFDWEGYREWYENQ